MTGTTHILYVYIYIYTYIHTYVYVYIYIYTLRNTTYYISLVVRKFDSTWRAYGMDCERSDGLLAGFGLIFGVVEVLGRRTYILTVLFNTCICIHSIYYILSMHIYNITCVVYIICIYIHTYIYTCVYMCMCMYIYIYIYIY